MNYTVDKKEFMGFIDSLKDEYELIAPAKLRNEEVAFCQITADKEIVPGFPKTARSPKNFFLPETDLLMTYELAENGLKNVKAVELPGQKRLLFGIRSCDLAAIPIMQKLYRTPDALLDARIDNTLFITVNCNKTCSETNFCSSVGTGPFAKQGFDVALTEMDGKYLVETGSEKGEKLIEKYSKLTDATEEDIKTKEKLMKASEDSIPLKFDITGIESKLTVEDERWEQKAKACMRCGGCNYICPTCVCFSVIDQADSRCRIIDSCMLSGFTMLAGGENPREKLSSRIIQRYFHKFQYTKVNDDYYSCVGCGRCTDVCLFNDDLGQTIKEISTK